MNLMILAAGLGTRLNPYSLEKPKPAIPFLGVPLAFYSLALLDKMKFKQIVVNTHHLSQQVETLFQSVVLPCKSLRFTLEKEQPLGSGGGINFAREYLAKRGDFLVMNGDEVILPHDPWLMREFITYHKQTKNLATLLVMKHPEVGSTFGGVWVDDRNNVKCFSKKPVDGLVGYHFLGVIVFRDEIFHYFKNPVQDENILYETLTFALQKNESASIYCCEAEWFESGNPKDFVSSSHYYCDQLLAGLSCSWKRDLADTIRRYGTYQKFIEKDYPELSNKLDLLWSKHCPLRPLK